MQRTVYCCDKCRKVIGDKPHFSLSFNQFSGVAMPPSSLDPVAREALSEHARKAWRVVEKLAGTFAHFCSVKCLAAFFEAALARATKPKKS